MSGYRMATGWGNLTRNNGESINKLPTGTAPTTAVQSLTKRFGGAMSLTLSRNNNNNYNHDIGFREFTIASQGTYECDWNLDGLIAPQYVTWLANVFMSDGISITSASTFTDASGTVITSPTATTVGYSTTDGVTPQNTLTYAEFSHYQTIIGTTAMVVMMFRYKRNDGIKTFDMGFVQNNSMTTYGGNNVVGVLTGCVVNSFTISYENGSDDAVKITLEGHALTDYVEVVDNPYDYIQYLDAVPKSTLIAGCLSTSEDGSTYTNVAITDSSSLTVTNNLSRLGLCLNRFYTAYAMGALDYSVSTSTYSNDPNKYLSKLYGYGTLAIGSIYYPSKQPYAIPYARIRADDTDAETTTATAFVDILMENVYTGNMDNTYDAENAVMDEPSLTPQHVTVVVGYTPA